MRFPQGAPHASDLTRCEASLIHRKGRVTYFISIRPYNWAMVDF